MPVGIPKNGINKGWFKKGHNISWKGNSASYFSKHMFVFRKRGNPKTCEHCGKNGKKVNGRWSIHWANISRKYLRNINDYMGLCPKCHKKYDWEYKKANK